MFIDVFYTRRWKYGGKLPDESGEAADGAGLVFTGQYSGECAGIFIAVFSTGVHL